VILSPFAWVATYVWRLTRLLAIGAADVGVGRTLVVRTAGEASLDVRNGSNGCLRVQWSKMSGHLVNLGKLPHTWTDATGAAVGFDSGECPECMG
jgi:hypothetical protein